MKRLTRKLIASLALFAMLGANALPLFAQDKAAEKPADAAAPAAAAPAAATPAASPVPAAAPAVPKCGDKGFDCNKGDVSWMMTSTAFVLLMTVPGLALFYAGMVRSKNALSTTMQSFSIFCVVAVLWVIFGYGMAFTAGNGPFIGAMPWTSAGKGWFMGLDDPTTAVAA